MDKRTKVGIVYFYSENWIGGTYYNQNLIRSLNLLEDKNKPHLVILSYTDSALNSVKELNYPYITYTLLSRKLSFVGRVKKKIFKEVFGLEINAEKRINFGIDVLFITSEMRIRNSIKKHLYWIPDFQEVYLPHLFSQESLDHRKASQLALLKKDKHILFSSQDASNDFHKLYPQAKSHTYVANFSVFHPDYSHLKIENLKEKYNLKDTKYFFSPNQFWQHKNHIIVLKAVKILKEKYRSKVQVLFSGKESDSRNPNYFSDLKEFVSENNLEENIKFLGFIDRSEQLCFMKNAIAVIQPSLFEGWSTVVEDAKAMNQNLIVSSLNVHQEQLKDKAYYFDPHDEEQLTLHIMHFLENEIQLPEFNYDHQLHLFGEKFINIISKIK